MYTIVMLIDFEGHPALGDDYINNLRYAALEELLSSKDIHNTVIVSTKGLNDKLNDIRYYAKRKGWIWPIFDNTHSVDSVIQTLEDKMDVSFNTKNTQIIFGGTNTSGCVLNNNPLALNKFVASGFDVKLYLPMCAEYQVPGLNATDKNMKAFSIVYEYLRKYNMIDQVNIIYNYSHLELMSN